MKPQDMTTFWWCVEGGLLALFTGLCMLFAHLRSAARLAGDERAERHATILLVITAWTALVQLGFFIYALTH